MLREKSSFAVGGIGLVGAPVQRIEGEARAVSACVGAGGDIPNEVIAGVRGRRCAVDGGPGRADAPAERVVGVGRGVAGRSCASGNRSLRCTTSGIHAVACARGTRTSLCSVGVGCRFDFAVDGEGLCGLASNTGDGRPFGAANRQHKGKHCDLAHDARAANPRFKTSHLTPVPRSFP